jgi:hypothetical protein
MNTSLSRVVRPSTTKLVSLKMEVIGNVGKIQFDHVQILWSMVCQTVARGTPLGFCEKITMITKKFPRSRSQTTRSLSHTQPISHSHVFCTGHWETSECTAGNGESEMLLADQLDTTHTERQQIRQMTRILEQQPWQLQLILSALVGQSDDCKDGTRALLFCIPEYTCSKLRLAKCHSDWNLPWFLPVPPVTYWDNASYLVTINFPWFLPVPPVTYWDNASYLVTKNLPWFLPVPPVTYWDNASYLATIDSGLEGPST